jgi:hypothetical protein
MELGGLAEDSAEELLRKRIAGRDLPLIHRLDPRFAPVNLADRRLNQLYRNVNRLFEETGTYDLFLGYPFVEGRFLDGTVARSPVLLFPVQLVRNLQGKPRWQLQVPPDEPIVFNRTFFLAYEHFQQLRLPAAFWEEEIDPAKDWHQWLNQLYQQVNSYELDVNVNPRLFDLVLNRFADWQKPDLAHLKPGVLTFQPQAVLGIFPQSDSALLSDYEAIAAQPESFALGQWLDPANPPPPPDEAPYLKEETRYFVTPVDQSQEEALLAVKGGQSLVLHGPPGTGKSQVIVNLIADAMAHGQRVLVVSQKRAALDVVYHRLQGLGLGRFAVLVHDYRHDRAPIYRQIKQQIDDLDHFKAELKDLNHTKQDHDYKVLSRQLDQYGRQYQALYDALTQPLPCGLPIHLLYQRCDAHQPRLPLGEVARQLDQTQLAQVLDRLRRLFDYADLFASDYPWRQRLSFRNYGHEEQQRLLSLLQQWPADIEALHQQYQTLSAHLSTRLLDLSLNRSRIKDFEQAQQWLMRPQVRADMEALHGDQLKAEAVADTLAQWEQALQRLDQRQYLDDHHWAFVSELIRHADAYRHFQGKPQRFFSLPYHRARWFFRKILQRHGLDLSPPIFADLDREVQALRQLQQLYGAQHELRFFETFSLLGDQADKWAWLRQKQAHVAAYAQVRSITFFPKIKPRFVHGRLDQSAWDHSQQQIEALARFTDRMQQLLDQWQSWLHPAQVATLREAVRAPQEPIAALTAWAQRLRIDFEDLRALDRLLADLTPLEQHVHAVIEPALAGSQTEAQAALLHQVENSIWAYWIEQAEQQQPLLAEVSSRGWPRKRMEYAQDEATRRGQVATLIRQRLMARIVDLIRYNRLKNPVTYREIYHQVSKQRRVWSLRKLVAETWSSGLSALAPCWMASPESVAAMFPMESGFFDLVIFDEASQCLVERALPVLLRGKQCVVAGDAQQLRPSDLYQVRNDDPEEAWAAHEQALEVESILDLARNRLMGIHLKGHYRSQEEALINFSNHAFYEGNLQVMPPAQADPTFRPVLEWVSVPGLWADQQNEAEATRILDLVIDLVQRPEPPTLGIVTFNYRQAQLIGDRLDERMEALALAGDPTYQRLQVALHRRVEEEWQGLFIKNIENVQGDERDVILFSVGYARDAQGRLSTNFGLLNQQGGENRLNVAISRARRKIYVLCSFLPHELQVEASRNAGPRYFRDYLAYVRAISEGQPDVAAALLQAQQADDSYEAPTNLIADALTERLRAHGYHVERDLGDTAYKIDLALKRHPDDVAYLLGIEVEGSYYFSGASSKEREVYRPNLLQQRGWTRYRVWARNWWRDAEGELTRILSLLERD